MKKLLSLIGAISIVGSGVSTVVGCGDDFSKPKNNDQAKADAIKDKIKQADLIVENIAAGTQNEATIKAIKTALQSQNPDLNNKDLAKITFNNVNLKNGEAVKVEATITVNKAKATKELNVTLAQTDQQKADAIKEKIVNDALIVPPGINPDTTNAATIIAIKTALQEENQTLTKEDLALIIFSDTALKTGTSVVVTATVTVNEATATKDLNITLAQSDQQKADAIKQKIIVDDITVPIGTNPDTSNTATIEAIKMTLKQANPTLTDDDLMKIEFSTASLRPYTRVAVLATITVGTAKTTKELELAIAETDQQKADRIKNKIVDVNLDIAVGTDPDTSNTATITAIKTALSGANSDLTTEDLAIISFSDTTLQAGTSVVVKAIITVGTVTAEKDLNVTLAQSDQQQADAIKAKITNDDLTVPVGTNPDTTISQTVDAIKVVLEADNVALTVDDLNAITFSATTLQAGNSIPVIAIITVGSGMASKDLNVTLAQTDQQKADAIKAKITNANLDIPAGTDPDTSNAATITAIKAALRGLNQTLTADDVQKIMLNSTTLTAGSAVTVTATITAGTATATIDLNVTLAQTDQQKANAIKDKITNVDVSIIAGLTPDPTNPQTRAAIRSAIGNANTTLTADDLTKITFSNTPLIPGSAVTITAGITVGSETVTIDINVTLMQSEQDKADAIKNKITNPDLIVPSGTFPSAINPDTETAIKRALKSQNQALTTDDLAKITWADTALIAGMPRTIAATITVGTATATINLNVTLADSDQEKADAIAQEITVLDYDIRVFGGAAAQRNTDSEYFRNTIKQEIANQNPVSESVLTIQQGIQLILDTPGSVTVIITVGSATANKIIMVTTNNPFG